MHHGQRIRPELLGDLGEGSLESLGIGQVNPVDQKANLSLPHGFGYCGQTESELESLGKPK